MADVRESFKLEVNGSLTGGATVVDQWEAPFPGEIVGIEAVLATAGTGTATTVDLKKNTVSVLTAPLSIAATQTQPAAPSAWAANTAYTVGQRVTVSQAQVGELLPQSAGSGTPGIYECVTAHTSGQSFQVAQVGGYGTTYWVQLPQGPNPPSPGKSTFVQGDIFTLHTPAAGTSAAGLDVTIQYVSS